MRKRRIFLGLLLVIALMAFVACSSNDGTLLDPDTPNTVTDNNGNGVNDDTNNNLDKAGNNLEDAADNAGNAAKDLVTTNGAVDKNTNNL
ncbi:hypothetical protein [Aminipila sp.]|uniref:hypothetical protein n=1 Tax=Aminipila sp. TaxID=2060095 RepID=UPI0028989EA6|nr:hypothetical protein [Aminipila sp.]